MDATTNCVLPRYRVVRDEAACTGCGQCEPRCPFGVPIPERMEKAAALFGC